MIDVTTTLSLFFRYDNENFAIKETFLDFFEIERINGEYIGKNLLGFYQKI